MTHRVRECWQAGQTGVQQTGAVLPSLRWRLDTEGPGEAGQVEAADLTESSQGAGQQHQLGLHLLAGRGGVRLEL